MMVRAKSSFKLVAEPESLSPSRIAIRRFLHTNGWAHRELDVIIATGEVIQNVIRHGFADHLKTGHFWVTLEITESLLSVTITDDAPPSRPDAWSAEWRDMVDGGHGLRLVRGLAREVTFTAKPDGNTAILLFDPD